MRLRNVKGARDVLAENFYVIQEPENCKGRWREVFGNDNPVYIEIGMGKGQFLLAHAELHPDINYVGVEMYASVLVRAVQKAEGTSLSDGVQAVSVLDQDKAEAEKRFPNVRFLNVQAEYLENIFAPGEVDRIYLNFSDPWPKDRHAKRRLPSEQFLGRYRRYLKQDGRIEFKTDNRALFDFAVEEAGKTGWIFEVLTYDLHHDEKLMQGNVMTEYEEKFSSIGNPIHKYIIYREKVPQEITVKS